MEIPVKFPSARESSTVRFLSALLLLSAAPAALGGGGAGQEGPTSAAPAPVNPAYRLLERKKLSDYERKKLEKERADRLKSAQKFLDEKLKEYQGVPWPNRHKITTQNFHVHCNSTRKVAEAYGVLVELIRAELAKMFPSRIHRRLKAPVFIYSSQEEFMAQDDYGRWAGRGLGGYYNPMSQAITVYHGTFGFTGTTFGVLCHEGTHYYQGLVLKEFDNIPVWLIEGLAVYFGDGSTFDPRTRKIEVGKIPRDRLVQIQDRIARKRHVPIEKLVGLTRRSGFTGYEYADAWALIHFLVNSGEKGKKLIKAYWSAGLERVLSRKDFLDLAQKHYGGVQELEKQYLEYIRAVEMPSAGLVVGDYFVSDFFQLDFKAPGDDWQFFEDRSDRPLLVGLLLPGSSAEIRLYYDNNLQGSPSAEYLKLYLVVKSGRFQDLKQETVKIANLDGFKLGYLDGGDPPPKDSGAKDPGKVKEKEKDGGQDQPSKLAPAGGGKAPRSTVEYLLVQVDGVLSIRCASTKEEAARFADLFNRVNQNITLTLTRRW